MKRTISLCLTVLLLTALCACGNSGGAKGTISVISREDGSGTRGAFVELMGIADKDGNDQTCDAAEITNSTSVMMTTVAGNEAAIGYVSLGSLSDSVKAVSVDGVEASVENINNGTYTVKRPFNLVYTEGSLRAPAQDFLTYILSDDGQKVISDNGYIAVKTGGAYHTSEQSGKITLAGSTSVAPVMEKLADAYKALHPEVSIEIQQTGSSAGISSATEGVCDLGMSSRELTDEEAAALQSVTIAMDGIAVIVNNANPVANLTSEQIRAIFTGEVTRWSEVNG